MEINAGGTCEHKRQEYLQGNTYCQDCKAWLHAGPPPAAGSGKPAERPHIPIATLKEIMDAESSVEASAGLASEDIGKLELCDGAIWQCFATVEHCLKWRPVIPAGVIAGLIAGGSAPHWLGKPTADGK